MPRAKWANSSNGWPGGALHFSQVCSMGTLIALTHPVFAATNPPNRGASDNLSVASSFDYPGRQYFSPAGSLRHMAAYSSSQGYVFVCLAAGHCLRTR